MGDVLPRSLKIAIGERPTLAVEEMTAALQKGIS